MAEPKQAFVTGWPIEHSRSPLIHNHWLKEHGIEGRYEKIAVAPDDFQKWITALPSSPHVGGNVTIPHKETAFAAVDHLDDHARALGAVNTVWHENGVLHGSNTDGYGFLANLNERVPGWNATDRLTTALVLGAGGAARAIVQALVETGFQNVVIANRTLTRAQTLCADFGPTCSAIELSSANDVAGSATLIVNTTSIGMGSSDDQAELPINVDALASNAFVTDIVYTPLVTPLLVAARKRGLQTADGLGMLLHQAVPGFERWFGVRPQVTTKLRNILLTDLGEPLETDPVFLGLTGSIGMGKSTTAEMFRDQGIPVHDADATVHRLYAGEAAPLVDAEFPGTMKNGMIDRTELSRHVIGNDDAMKRLEAIVHPLVHRETLKFRRKAIDDGAALAVIDHPLLFEMEAADSVDGIIVVTAPADVQRDRVMARDGMTEEKFQAILDRQIPDAEKRRRADFIIDTSKGLDSARSDVARIIATVQSGDSKSA